MNAGRIAIIGTLIIAFAMGLYSFFAITRTAGRRATLVDDVAARMPAIEGARVLTPWEPATYADDVRAMYCIDGVDPATGASRAINALAAAGWTLADQKRDDAAETVVFFMAGPVRLRGGVARGTRPDCDGKKNQVTLALDGAK